MATTNEPSDTALEKTPKRRRFIPLFGFIVILLLMSGGSYSLWLYKDHLFGPSELDEVKSRVSRLETRLEQFRADEELARHNLRQELIERQGDYADSLSVMTNEHQMLRNNLDTRLADFAQHMQEIQVQASNQADRLGDGEASEYEDVLYLLQLARTQVNLQHDAGAALESLLRVDAMLVTLDFATSDQIRKDVLQAIQQLRVAAKVDLRGLLMRLDLLAAMKLEFRGPELRLQDTKPATDAENTGRSAEGFFDWSHYWQQTLSLVRVQTHEDLDVKPLLNQEERRLIGLRIQIGIERAKLAVLQRDQILYIASLDGLLELGQHYLIQGIATTERFRTELEHLAEISIEKEELNIDATIRQLKVSISSNHASVRQFAEQTRSSESESRENNPSVNGASN